MNPKKPNTDRWYEEHIDMLRAWQLNRFPDIEDVDDLVQESFFELSGAVESSGSEFTLAGKYPAFIEYNLQQC